jgi:CheY-like chemotaxis protein
MILVVEDDQDLREMVAELLRCEGYEVACAKDGIEALAALEDGPRPSFILIDLGMPKMGGIEFRRAQRKDPRFAEIPLAFMSGETTPQSRMGSLAPEDHAPVLKKPIGLDTLFAAIPGGAPRTTPTRRSAPPGAFEGVRVSSS